MDSSPIHERIHWNCIDLFELCAVQYIPFFFFKKKKKGPLIKGRMGYLATVSSLQVYNWRTKMDFN